jgi:hypothetical protein
MNDFRRKLGRLSLVALALACAVPVLAQNDQEAVESLYPQSLLDDYYANVQENGAEPFRGVAYTPADLVGSGHADDVVAAYTNGFAGAIRVLRRERNGLVVAAAPEVAATGALPHVEAVNLDGTGGDEVIATFSAATGNESVWVFRWDGTSLQSVGPVVRDSDGTPRSALVNAGWLDLDGDGVLEIYTPQVILPIAEGETVRQAFDVYRWNGQSFAPSRPVKYVRQFFRGRGEPEAVSDSFSATAGNHVLRIVSGAQSVSSAVVLLNGRMVAGPRNFSQEAAVIEIPVVLREENQLSVELRSAPGGSLTIVFE